MISVPETPIMLHAERRRLPANSTRYRIAHLQHIGEVPAVPLFPDVPHSGRLAHCSPVDGWAHGQDNRKSVYHHVQRLTQDFDYCALKTPTSIIQMDNWRDRCGQPLLGTRSDQIFSTPT